MNNRRRPREDNVIYANFGRRDAAAQKGSPARGARGRGPNDVEVGEPRGRGPRSSRTPRVQREQKAGAGRNLNSAALRLLRASQISNDLGRIKRGREYAKNGHVVAMQFLSGRIVGAVKGSQNEPFSTTIELPYRSVDELTAVTRNLAEDPAAIPLARKGSVEERVLDVLIAKEPGDIRFHCDCPDRSAACKHAVALAEVAAMRLGEYPDTVFELRGLNIEHMAREAAEEAHRQANRGENLTNEQFWEGEALPALPELAVLPAIDESDVDLLHQAMRQVSYTAVEQLQAVSDIEELYEHLTGLNDGFVEDVFDGDGDDDL